MAIAYEIEVDGKTVGVYGSRPEICDLIRLFRIEAKDVTFIVEENNVELIALSRGVGESGDSFSTRVLQVLRQPCYQPKE